ncbi:hypothetical protein [Pseudomonas aeruginosa]|uniref:hypothetical protein n=1 Tax=Pseudomonas aeruginosa TaxID=287 RepID=UPI0007100E3D|nr:hypothetical protein [Pseudomonas aeruginosa]
MNTPLESCPVWQRYLEVVAAAGAMPNHLAAKSSLYHRLRTGKQPLVLPPPLSHSYPWYDVVESEKVFAPLAGPVAYEPLTEADPPVDVVWIDQTPWLVVERINNSELIVSQPGWLDLGFRWRYWHKPTRADQSEASMIAHYDRTVGRITTSAQLDLECRYQAEHWKAHLEIAVSSLGNEVKLLGIDPDLKDAEDTLRVRMNRAAAQMRLDRAVRDAQDRVEKGLPAVPPDAEVEAYVQRYRTSLLEGSFQEQDGWLYVDGWALQRISPEKLGPEHYLPGASVTQPQASLEG